MTMRIILTFLLCIIFQNVNTQFFTQYWAKFDGKISNWNIPNASVSAEDATMAIHPGCSKTHKETQINGLKLVVVNEPITDIKRAGILLEMWGGHLETSIKRFSINGRGTYPLLGKENTMWQCEYIFPSIPTTDASVPLWAQLNRPPYEKLLFRLIPKKLKARIVGANLGWWRIWDGGEGDVKVLFKVNNIAYSITSKKAIQDLICSKNKVDPSNLKYGENAIELDVDTHHHGIEMLLPFPALLIKLKNK